MTVTTRRRRTRSALALTAVLALAACGGDDGTATPDTTAGPADTAVLETGSDEFSEADVFFAQHMIPHHEQAVEMAEIALDPAVGANDDVRALATEIEGAQDAEIELMAGWLTSWGQPVEMDMTDDHSMESMQGMMTLEEMDELATASGPDFDTLWLEMMIEHHRGAISMADDVLAEGTNPDVADLAREIIAAQQGEIDTMETLLGR
jgi:uncharacterized protein (DUF305 family)